MADTMPCPDGQELIQLLLGQCPADMTELLAHHLETCAPCQETLKELSTEDPLVQSFRAPPAPDQTAVQGLVARMQALSSAKGDTRIGRGPSQWRDEDGDFVLADQLASGVPALVPETRPEVGKRARKRGASAAGTVQGEYELFEEIARGGMGVVYKARHRKLNRLVALKLTERGPQARAGFAERFLNEAGAAAKLDHRHIVPIYEFGEDKEYLYFAMAFIEGSNLGQAVSAGPLPPRRAAEMMKSVAEAIAYAHAQGVIHRDLKPTNILLDGTGQPRVADFGLAKRTDAESGVTRDGQVLGTPSYMPPEQAQARNEQVGPLADVYSWGQPSTVC